MAVSFDAVTVVSGLPRSGTSMMMQMLAAGNMPVLVDESRAADDDNPRGYFEYAPVKDTRSDASWVNAAVGRAVKVVHALLPDLPRGYEYRVIFMIRDLKEVVASQQSMLERLGQRGGGLEPSQLVEVYQREYTRTLDWLDAQDNFDLLRVEYAEALKAPEAIAREIVQFIGAGVDPGAMAEAVRPSMRRQGAT